MNNNSPAASAPPQYLSLPRVAFKTNVLSPGFLPRFARDIGTTSFVLNRLNSSHPTVCPVIETEELFCPTFEINVDSVEKIWLNAIQPKTSFQDDLEIEFLRREDHAFFHLMNAMYRDPHPGDPHNAHVNYTDVPKLDKNILGYFGSVFARLERGDYQPQAIICHPSLFFWIATMCDSKHLYVYRYENIRHGFADLHTDTTCRGTFFGIPFYTNNDVDIESIYFIGNGACDYVVRQKPAAWYSVVSKKRRRGIWGTEEVGFSITDARGVWKLRILDLQDSGIIQDKITPRYTLEIPTARGVHGSAICAIVDSMPQELRVQPPAGIFGWTHLPDKESNSLVSPILNGTKMPPPDWA